MNLLKCDGMIGSADIWREEVGVRYRDGVYMGRLIELDGLLDVEGRRGNVGVEICRWILDG